ncbi:MAG TPA: 30S ribosomal protein S19 [Candidatus Nanoarchaeia archaeon]|nr:30S ribosomal protein S19 [Candidatus Nanoarchaeia archaeon]
MAKEFLYRGKSLEQLRKMSLSEFTLLLNSREKRKLKRGFTEVEKKLLETLRETKKDIRTHCRDMIIIPEMVGRIIKIHNGKDWVPINIMTEMLGHRLGEYSMTAKPVRHSAPGIGATKSSASLSVR